MSDDGIFRPMTGSDVESALAIINDHDEDDFAWASETYADSLLGQYVLEKDGRVIGVTGATPVDGTDQTYLISWTYLTRDFIGRGYGRNLLENIVSQIRRDGGRKVFVNTSDYVDPEAGDIYRDAREAYRAVGFTEELRHLDYYAKNEAMISYGMRLQPHEVGDGQRETNELQVRLTDIDEIDECDGAYWLAWELDEEGSDTSGLEMIVNQVKEWEGRVIFMAFPTDVVNAPEFMTRCRFRKDGQLHDYFEDGVDEVHYRLDLF